MGKGQQGLATADQGVDKMIRSIAPGLPAHGLPLDQIHRGGMRMAAGNWLSQNTPLGGLGQMLQNSGQRAMGRQATKVNTRVFRDNFNTAAQGMQEGGRMAGGPAAGVVKQMEQYKKLNPGNQNMVPGAVAAKTMEQAKSRAAQALKNPVGAKGIPSAGKLKGALGGSLAGGLVAGPMGMLGGGLAGAGLASGSALPIAAGGGLLATKMLGGGGKPKVDSTGAPQDRNRVLPFMSNNWAGGLGGALLASIIGREMGLQGPLSWLLPILGGVAGYKMFPGLVNSWSDPKGVGANAVPQIQRLGNAQNFGYRPQG
jgi:hypothetical protein